MMTNETETTLIETICERVMRYTAELAFKSQNLNIEKLNRILRDETKAGYDSLIADLKKSDEAFYGNQGMMNLTLNTACVGIAQRAWQKYQM